MKDIGIWELAVLALLREAPMHPYQMQRLLHQRHKDEILALKRGSLYHAIGRLLRAGYVEAAETSRDGRRPERTSYRICPSGLEEFLQALRKAVALPRRESAEFMAAMSFLVHLSSDEAVVQLKARKGTLEVEISSLEAGLSSASAHVQRINLIESEYLLSMLRAEAIWVRDLLTQIASGALSWEPEVIFHQARTEFDSSSPAED